MKKFTAKRIFAALLAVLLTFSLTACGGKKDDPEPEEKKFRIGICQLVVHPALDEATKGFMDALTEKLGDRVEFDLQIAAGEFSTATTICGTFVSDGVDLIMANATPALQGASAATGTVPILGTSISDYGTALELDMGKTTGINVSGTSDLAPLDEQAKLLKDLFPDAKKVGLLFCSGESNSVFQADAITPFLEAQGLEVERFTYADSNDLAAVTQTACDGSDVIYIPTDNTAAAYSETINNVASFAKVPIITGDEGICKGCGCATLSISYYELGRVTGEMAFEVLVNGADVSKMEIKYAPSVTKEFNPALCELFGLNIPEDFIAIGG